MVHLYERHDELAIVEVDDFDSEDRFALVRLHDDGTISAAARWDVARYGLRRATMTAAGVMSVATVRSRRAARAALARVER